MKKSFVLVLLFFCSISFSQIVDQYQYAYVPAKFAFLKKNDEYRLNTLTKFLMEKYGFITYMEGDSIPAAVFNDNCNKLYVEVINVGNFFTAKLKVTLSDCKKNVLFTSAVGVSKQKEYNVAYNEALRNAFKSFDGLHYKYNPALAAAAAVDVPKANPTPNIGNNVAVIAPVAAVTTAATTATKTVAATGNNISETPSVVLFAQPITNGYQLVDSTPKIVMKIFKTSNANYFIAAKGDLQGALVLKENQWFFEYYQNEKLISEKVEVKF